MVNMIFARKTHNLDLKLRLEEALSFMDQIDLTLTCNAIYSSLLFGNGRR